MAVQRPEATDDAPGLPGRSSAEDGGGAIFLASRGMSVSSGEESRRAAVAAKAVEASAVLRPDQSITEAAWAACSGAVLEEPVAAPHRALKAAMPGGAQTAAPAHKTDDLRDCPNGTAERLRSARSRVAAWADYDDATCSRPMTACLTPITGSSGRWRRGRDSIRCAPHCARRPCPSRRSTGTTRVGRSRGRVRDRARRVETATPVRA